MEGPSERKFKTICVFAGAKLGKNSEYLSAANNLGRVLAARNINLVYGGGSLGLMGVVAASAHVGGSKVLGIIPKALAEKKITGGTLGNELQVSSMHERMANMLYNSDAFIALPGGLGTLEEIFNIASWSQLCIHQKPLGLLNVNGFYDGLLSFLDHLVEQEFISPSVRKILISSPTAEQMIDQLLAYVPEPDPLLSHINWNTKDSRKKQKANDGLDLTLRL